MRTELPVIEINESVVNLREDPFSILITKVNNVEVTILTIKVQISITRS